MINLSIKLNSLKIDGGRCLISIFFMTWNECLLQESTNVKKHYLWDRNKYIRCVVESDQNNINFGEGRSIKFMCFPMSAFEFIDMI